MKDVDRLLQSIGKRCFRNCYETAAKLEDSFSTDDLLVCDPELEGTSPKAQRTRVSKIKRLVREGLTGGGGLGTMLAGLAQEQGVQETH